MHAENSNGTTVRTFSNFNLLRDHCMLLPFPSTLTSLCTPETTEWTVVDLDEEGGGEDKITCTSKCMVQRKVLLLLLSMGEGCFVLSMHLEKYPPQNGCDRITFGSVYSITCLY